MKHWKPPKMWQDGTCWIIGGGTSLPRQFGVPEKVIKSVESQEEDISVYSEYLKPLHDQHVIGVNMAFLLGDWISALYFCDRGFFRSYRKQVLNFKNLKVTDTASLGRPLNEYGLNIKRMRRDNRKGLCNRQDTICWNMNSGAAAINFAVHLGATRIMLLGFDMKPSSEGLTHWHAGHLNYTRPTLEPVFKRFLKGFPVIANDARRRGIEILNVNPDSAIEDFKKVSLKDVL